MTAAETFRKPAKTGTVETEEAARSIASLPPGPREGAFFQLKNWLFRLSEFLDECHARYGDTFTVRLPRFPPIVFVADPATVKEVFTSDPDLTSAGQANLMLKPTLGAKSLLLLDGPRHRAERKLLMPPFHGDRMRAYADIIRAATRATIEGSNGVPGWPQDRAFPVDQEMKRITMIVMLRAVFGVEEGKRFDCLRRRIDRLLHLGNHPLFYMMINGEGEVRHKDLQERFPLSPWSVFLRAHREVDSLLNREIAERRLSGEVRADVLSMLVAARDETGAALDEQTLRDEMLTLLVAGHKTTATTLTWVLYWMLSEPGVWSKVRAEVEGGGHEYLDCVIKETMRLNPTIPFVLRRLQVATRIGDREIPAGVIVAPAMYLTHRRPASWPDPQRFDPERFRDSSTSYDYFPFGGGTRRCLGAAFALHEMRIVIAEIVRIVELSLPRGYRARPVRRGIALSLADGLPVKMRLLRSTR
jgi:cytochrome P450